MKLKYETAVATLIQFVTMSILNVATGTVSVVSTCHNSSSDCVSNLLVSLIFFLLIVGWFAAVWVLGYAAQERRSKNLAYALIGAELLIALVALFNAKHHTDTLSLITSLIDLALAIWVISLAIRLIRAKGGRIVSKQRARHRPTKRLWTQQDICGLTAWLPPTCSPIRMYHVRRWA